MLSGCGSDPENKLIVDVSNIKVDLTSLRWDQELANCDTFAYASFANEKFKTQPKMWNYYVKGVLNLGDPRDPMFPDNFSHFMNQPQVQLLNRVLDSSYQDVSFFESEIKSGFAHLKFYYKDAFIPKVVFVNSFFNRSVWSADSSVFVALDYYLGNNHWLINSLGSAQGFYDYIKRKMDRDYFGPDLMQSWFETHYMGDVKTDQFGTPQFSEFLDALIYYGKLMYAMNAFYPEMAPHLKMRYTKEQMTWAISNEERIWVTMVDRKLVHSKSKKNMDDFFKEGPFTPGLKENEAPDRIGVFVGLRIIQDYMNSHPDLNLVDLMNIQDNQELLNAYNPTNEE